MMRSKYGEYPEYHTSLDDLTNVVTPSGLEGGYKIHKRAIEAIEKNYYPVAKTFGEPQLGKRGLYSIGSKDDPDDMLNLISWSDGTKSLLEIAELCDVPIWKLFPIAELLFKYDLLDLCENSLNHDT